MQIVTGTTHVLKYHDRAVQMWIYQAPYKRYRGLDLPRYHSPKNSHPHHSRTAFGSRGFASLFLGDSPLRDLGSDCCPSEYFHTRVFIYFSLCCLDLFSQLCQVPVYVRLSHLVLCWYHHTWYPEVKDAPACLAAASCLLVIDTTKNY